MKTLAGALSLVTIVLFCSVTAFAQTQPAASAEAKLVEETYGQAIKDAKGTPADADDLDVANQMLTSAGDKSASTALRAALARKALEVLVPLGSSDAATSAKDAMAILDASEPMPAPQKVTMLKDLAESRLARAKLDRKPKEEILPLAREAVDSYMDYVQAMMSDDSAAADVSACLEKARGLMSAYSLTEVKTTLDGIDNDVKGATARRNRIKALMPKIEEARAAKDAAGLATLYKQAVDTCLECDGNLTVAATFVQDSDPRAAAIKAAAAFVKDPKSLDQSKAPDNIKALSDISDKLPVTGKANVGEVALAMAQAYMAKAPSGIASDRVKLMIPRLEASSGQTPQERLRRQIAKAYGSLQGKLEIIDKENVRLTYDFRTPAQLRDWTVQRGGWSVASEALFCRTAPYDDGRIKCNLAFRFDKPWKITYNGAGRYEINSALLIFPWQFNTSYPYWYLHFDLTYRGASLWGLLDYYYYYENYWYDGNYKCAQGTNYKTEITGDGKGNITWVVNGVTVRKMDKARNDRSGYGQGSFNLRLATAGSDRVPTGFDNVVIQGVLLPSPDWVPQGAKSVRPAEVDDAVRPGSASSKPAQTPVPAPDSR